VAATRPTHVFLNVPFDDGYEPLYVALIAALTAFGSTPRTVLEIPPTNARLERLRALVAQCGASVHDLSRVELSGKRPHSVPRFNMPFELGLALGIHPDPKQHAWFIFESTPYRVDRSLSDLKGYDPHIHNGTPEGILRAVTNAFGAKNRKVKFEDLEMLWHALRDLAPRIKSERESLFTHAAFADLVIAGRELAAGRFAHSSSPVPSLPRAKHAK